MTARIPRYLTRRPVDHRDPAQSMLAAYGITEYVPETATIEWTRRGIVIEQLARAEDGNFLMHETDRGPIDVVTVRKFYPHPKESR